MARRIHAGSLAVSTEKVMMTCLDRYLDAWKCTSCGKIGCQMIGAKPAIIEGRSDDELGFEYRPDWEFGCAECVNAEGETID